MGNGGPSPSWVMDYVAPDFLLSMLWLARALTRKYMCTQESRKYDRLHLTFPLLLGSFLRAAISRSELGHYRSYQLATPIDSSPSELVCVALPSKSLHQLSVMGSIANIKPKMLHMTICCSPSEYFDAGAWQWLMQDTSRMPFVPIAFWVCIFCWSAGILW